MKGVESYGRAGFERRDVDMREMRLHKREEKWVIELK